MDGLTIDETISSSPRFTNGARTAWSYIKPIFDEEGRRIGSIPILQDETGRFEARSPIGNSILLEPNVGIGPLDVITCANRSTNRGLPP
jgi:hypothetical protein